MRDPLTSLIARSRDPDPLAIQPRLLSRYEDPSSPADAEALEFAAQVVQRSRRTGVDNRGLGTVDDVIYVNAV